MKGGLPYTPIKDLSPTERELLGISAPADTVHGPEPLIGEPGTEETGGNPDGNPKASPPIDTDEEPDVEVKPTSPVPGSDEELDEGEGVRVPFKKPADHSDSEPEAAKKASARKSLPSKSKEDAAALRKKEAIAKKREADDKAQRADRAAAKKAAAKRQQEADDRARKAANGVVPYTRADRDALHGALQQKVDQAETQTAASLLKTTKMRQYERKSTGARGPSQVVTYSSSFIDKLR